VLAKISCGRKCYKEFSAASHPKAEYCYRAAQPLERIRLLRYANNGKVAIQPQHNLSFGLCVPRGIKICEESCLAFLVDLANEIYFNVMFDCVYLAVIDSGFRGHFLSAVKRFDSHGPFVNLGLAW
jgi:hypothetical protein